MSMFILLCLMTLAISTQAHGEFNWDGCTTKGLPDNFQIRCNTTNGCTVTCQEGYELSNSALDIKLKCRNGSWTYLMLKHIPHCNAVCFPVCQNGGECLAPGFCKCNEQFAGPHCQYPSSACDIASVGYDGGYNCYFNSQEYSCDLYCTTVEDAVTQTCDYSTGIWSPPINNCYTVRTDSQEEFKWKNCTTKGLPSWFFPKGSLIHCRSDTGCEVTCPEGYQFSNGTDHLNLQCKDDDGMWIYPHVNSTGIPKCQAGCSPSCQNGGKCIAPGHCDCTEVYKGDLCQYPLSNCNITSVDYDGAYSCYYNDIEYSCDLYCTNQVKTTHMCKYSTGIWSPTIEKCRYIGVDIS